MHPTFTVEVNGQGDSFDGVKVRSTDSNDNMVVQGYLKDLPTIISMMIAEAEHKGATMDNEERIHLERWADQLEALARDKRVLTLVGEENMDRNALFGIAHDVKQQARRGTPSYGI